MFCLFNRIVSLQIEAAAEKAAEKAAAEKAAAEKAAAEKQKEIDDAKGLTSYYPIKGTHWVLVATYVILSVIF